METLLFQQCWLARSILNQIKTTQYGGKVVQVGDYLANLFSQSQQQPRATKHKVAHMFNSVCTRGGSRTWQGEGHKQVSCRWLGRARSSC